MKGALSTPPDFLLDCELPWGWGFFLGPHPQPEKVRNPRAVLVQHAANHHARFVNGLGPSRLGIQLLKFPCDRLL